MGIRVGFSDIEGVVSTFFLIRYQTIIASSREINLARQFCSVSLIHRMETKIARHLFKILRLCFCHSAMDVPLTQSVPSIIAILPEDSAGGQPQFWGKTLVQKILSKLYVL